MNKFGRNNSMPDIPDVPPFEPSSIGPVQSPPPPLITPDRAAGPVEPPGPNDRTEPTDDEIARELQGLNITEGIPLWEDIGPDRQKNRNARTRLEVLERSRQDAGVLNNLGCTYMWAHQWWEARGYFDRACAAAEDFNDAKEDARANLAILDRIHPESA
jgi:hypothetical protein